MLIEEKGFTLAEMLVTISVLGILLATTAVGLGTLAPQFDLDNAARKVAMVLNQGRVQAITRGHTTVVAFGTSLVLQFGFGWPRDAAYYSVVLGTLLVHYYLDAINFTRWGLVVRDPSAAELGRGIVNVPEAAVA